MPVAPDPSKAIASLKNIQGVNDPVDLLGLQQERKSEFEDRAIKSAQAGDPQESAAMRALAGQYQQDIAESPLTKQKTETDAWQQAQDQARLMGYEGMTPAAEAGKFGRQLETRKVEAPVDVAGLQGRTARDVAGIEQAGGAERARIAAGSQTDVANIRAQQAEQGYTNLLAMVQGGRTPSHVAMPGGPSVSFAQDRPVPAGVENALVKAREELVKSGSHWYGAGSPTPEAVAGFQQAAANYLQSHPASNDIKAAVSGILANPKMKALPWSQILTTPGVRLGELPDDEQYQIRGLLSTLRGSDF
jgi:hypothetical protein